LFEPFELQALRPSRRLRPPVRRFQVLMELRELEKLLIADLRINGSAAMERLERLLERERRARRRTAKPEEPPPARRP
jgi:hypothetical protein